MNEKYLVMILLVISIGALITAVIITYGVAPISNEKIDPAILDQMEGDAVLIEVLEDELQELGKKEYEPFSKEKFPDTDGFNPAWLEGERDLILESCAEAKSMGYENTYCKYVQ